MEDRLNQLDQTLVGIPRTELEEECQQGFMEPNISISCKDNGG